MGSPIIYNTLSRPLSGILDTVWISSSSIFFPLTSAMAHVSMFIKDTRVLGFAKHTFTFSSDLSEQRWLGLGLGLVY